MILAAQYQLGMRQGNRLAQEQETAQARTLEQFKSLQQLPLAAKTVVGSGVKSR